MCLLLLFLENGQIWRAYFGNRSKLSMYYLFLATGTQLLASTVPMGYRNTPWIPRNVPRGIYIYIPRGPLDLPVLHVRPSQNWMCNSCMGGFSVASFLHDFGASSILPNPLSSMVDETKRQQPPWRPQTTYWKPFCNPCLSRPSRKAAEKGAVESNVSS